MEFIQENTEEVLESAGFLTLSKEVPFALLAFILRGLMSCFLWCT